MGCRWGKASTRTTISARGWWSGRSSITDVVERESQREKRGSSGSRISYNSDSEFGASIQTVSTAADSHQCQSHAQTYESCYEGNSGSRCRQEVTTRQQQKIHYEDCYG